MRKTAPRKICRIAFLQEYENRPEKLMALIPEVSEKGYHAAAFAVRIGQEDYVAELAAEAARHNLEVMAFSGFMKYQQAWIKDHPEQSIRLNTEGEAMDQDAVEVLWGCPFHPCFKQRYFDFLSKLGRIPNMSEVWVNDEAYLGFGPDRLACYCPVCEEAWRKEFGGKIPRPPFTDRALKARWADWRFRRWNAVHAEMKAVLCRDHPVRTVFLTSVACVVGKSPLITGVDLVSMADDIDGIMTDPYYTFHGHARIFKPREVYLSECCRILAGMCGSERRAEICAQGFSHGTFTRPLNESDGWWAGIVPVALGINAVTAYTYTLQRISPMQKTYEKSFALDQYFSRTAPVDFVGVVNSLATQCFHMDGEDDRSWQVGRLLPVSEILRHHALPYGYVPSGRLDPENVRRFPVLVLPSVTCMSAAAREALRDYARNGGVLIACGETATRDETGELLEDGAWLEEVFGVRDLEPAGRNEEIEPHGEQPSFQGLPWPDEVTAGYKGGVMRPVLGLNDIVRAAACADVETIAVRKDAADTPAITRRTFGAGQAVFVAGTPAHQFQCRQTKAWKRNFIGYVLRNLILRLAGARLPLRVNNFTADIPMFRLRPVDTRLFPTAEFMPCIGDDLYLATIASYFRESMRFEIEAKIPPGAVCKKIKELVSGRLVRDFRKDNDRIKLKVALNSDDALKVFGFFWGRDRRKKDSKAIN